MTQNIMAQNTSGGASQQYFLGQLPLDNSSCFVVSGDSFSKEDNNGHQGQLFLKIDPRSRGIITNSPVYFKAIMRESSSGVTGAGAFGNFNADEVIQNLGQGYNSTTGTFTAQLKGLYNFQCNVVLSPVSDSMKTGYSGFTKTSQGISDPFISNLGLVRDHINRVAFRAFDSFFLEPGDTVSCFARVFGGGANSLRILGADEFGGVFSFFSGQMTQQLS